MNQTDVETYFEWLDDMRASGTTNMMLARPPLAKKFNLDRAQSTWVHAEWMKSFNPMEPVAKRAAWALKQGAADADDRRADSR